MHELWYYANTDTTRTGPLPRETIAGLVRAGTLTTASLVWKSGMKSWEPISAHVRELGISSIVLPPVPTPPPIPGTESSASPAPSASAAKSEDSGWQQKLIGNQTPKVAVLALLASFVLELVAEACSRDPHTALEVVVVVIVNAAMVSFMCWLATLEHKFKNFVAGGVLAAIALALGIGEVITVDQMNFTHRFRYIGAICLLLSAAVPVMTAIGSINATRRRRAGTYVSVPDQERTLAPMAWFAIFLGAIVTFGVVGVVAAPPS